MKEDPEGYPDLAPDAIDSGNSLTKHGSGSSGSAGMRTARLPYISGYCARANHPLPWLACNVIYPTYSPSLAISGTYH